MSSSGVRMLTSSSSPLVDHGRELDRVAAGFQILGLRSDLESIYQRASGCGIHLHLDSDINSFVSRQASPVTCNGSTVLGGKRGCTGSRPDSSRKAGTEKAGSGRE